MPKNGSISFLFFFFYLACPKGHTVSKNGSISFFTRDALKGHTVSKNGLRMFFS